VPIFTPADTGSDKPLPLITIPAHNPNDDL
jgi:hypothetical protein